MSLVCTALPVFAAAALAAERPPIPAQKTDPACEWVWTEGKGVALWTESCKLATGHWQVKWDDEVRGFALWVNDERTGTVVQLFTLAEGAGIATLLPELRARKLITDTDDCVFEPAAMWPAPRTMAFFEIKPKGEALKLLEATPPDEVPEPPCGDYGWGTHGTRYFITDIRHPGTVIYADEGQDGMMFDPKTIRLER
jgi:hypothetical protein